jgi:hypothetical protein
MADPKDTPGNKYYHYINMSEVPDSVRFKPKDKLPKRYLVWQALDQFGNVSEPYIKMGTMKAEEYKSECLEKWLLPFILKYHSIPDVYFWPDLATIHYQKDVQNWLNSKGIQFVAKSRNAPNVPQLRPIEKFWALCKQMYSKRDQKPKNIIGF